MHGKGKTAPRFHHAHPNTLYFHCILTFSCNLRVWRRTRPVSDRATVFDTILIAFLFYCTLQTLSRDVTSMETITSCVYECASRNSWPGLYSTVQPAEYVSRVQCQRHAIVHCHPLRHEYQDGGRKPSLCEKRGA